MKGFVELVKLEFPLAKKEEDRQIYSIYLTDINGHRVLVDNITSATDMRNLGMTLSEYQYNIALKRVQSIADIYQVNLQQNLPLPFKPNWE